MRIDLNQASASQIASEPSSKPVSTQSVNVSDHATEDRTTLSSAQQPLSQLVSTAMSSPEIRQDKVDSLKQALESGNYKLDPGKIAESMIDEQA
jgi:negative regulator of flagellin synthesis FlgM